MPNFIKVLRRNKKQKVALYKVDTADKSIFRGEKSFVSHSKFKKGKKIYKREDTSVEMTSSQSMILLSSEATNSDKNQNSEVSSDIETNELSIDDYSQIQETILEETMVEKGHSNSSGCSEKISDYSDFNNITFQEKPYSIPWNLKGGPMTSQYSTQSGNLLSWLVTPLEPNKFFKVVWQKKPMIATGMGRCTMLFKRLYSFEEFERTLSVAPIIIGQFSLIH